VVQSPIANGKKISFFIEDDALLLTIKSLVWSLPIIDYFF
jgi:hypothetical protein